MSSLYLSLASAMIPFLAWYPLKRWVKRDRPTKNVPVTLEDGSVVELGGTKGGPTVEMGAMSDARAAARARARDDAAGDGLV